jgi:hypothetical protein
MDAVFDIDGGPHLSVAVLCQNALEEKDGVHSLIRMIDRLTLTTGPVEAMPEFQANLLLFLSFKSGSAKGPYEAKVVLVNPEGEDQQHVTIPFFCEGEERGNNIRVMLAVPFKRPGLYWFNILLGDQLITRVPLRVIHMKTAHAN